MQPASQTSGFGPLPAWPRWLGTLSLSLAVFMVILDSSVANVSIQRISGDLGVAVQQGAWTITWFAVANAVAIPLTGWLTPRIGQVRLFVGSVLLFVLASWLCGLATSVEWLIAARILQGMAAGPIVPLSQALLLPSYPAAEIAWALALWGTVTLVAPILGPLLGGWISDNHHWSWIFYLNIPIGLISAWLTWLIYRARELPRGQKMPVDTWGLVLLVTWVAALQVMLDKGRELDWFGSAFILVLAAVALTAFAVFVVWELGERHPIVDLSLLRRRNFLVGTVTVTAGYGLFFGGLVILPLWLQTQLGYSATDAGIAMAPVGFLAILLTPMVGHVLPRSDPRWLASAGLLVFALVFYWRSGFSTEVDTRSLILPTVIQGAAMAMFFTPLNAIVLSGLAQHEIPHAASLFLFCRTMFAGVCTSLFGTLWDRRAALHREALVSHLASGVQAFEDTLKQLEANGFDRDQALGVIDNALTTQAATMAVVDIFRLAAVVFLGLIGLVWLARPVKPRPAG